MMTNILEGVVNHGTAASARGRGLGNIPAAGKTGTSRDGWFAGYTKDYIAIAWVGFDDNTDLNLEGARSALPIWTEFMAKAYALRPPRDFDAMYFAPPEGIALENIPRDGHEPPAQGCDKDHEESFFSSAVPSPLECGEPHSSTNANTVSGGFIGKIGKALGSIFGGKKN